jgi:hypothetical protein
VRVVAPSISILPHGVREVLRVAESGAAGEGVPTLKGSDRHESRPPHNSSTKFPRQLHASQVRYRFQAFAPVAGKAHAFCRVARWQVA